MDNLIYSSAKSIAKAIRDKKVSAREVVEAHLKRIEEVNPKLSAVVTLCGERALDEARVADESLAKGEVQGPLHGVPMTLKDSLDTAGVLSTAAPRAAPLMCQNRTRQSWHACVQRGQFSSESPTLLN